EPVRITSLNKGHQLVKVCVATQRESSHFATERKRPASSIGPRHPPADVRPVTGRRDVTHGSLSRIFFPSREDAENQSRAMPHLRCASFTPSSLGLTITGRCVYMLKRRTTS